MVTVPALPTPRGAGAFSEKIQPDARLREAANKMEAAFLSEMLKSAGLGTSRQSFGGGAGEDQFSSFLREEQARGMVEAGGIGLAESLFEAMKERMHAG